MRVIFMGTPDFAVPTLQALADAHDVVAVFTRPDGASGRGGALRPSAVKVAAIARGLEVHQPPTLRDEAVLASIIDLRADVIVVAAYGLILPREVLDAAPLGAVNVHASVLPAWRGAAPIERAILAGDERAGVSIMRMEEGLDTGPYCLQLSTPVDEKTSADLTIELAEMGARALIEALELMEHDRCEWQEQDETAATYAAKIEKSELLLDPSLSRDVALRMVRSSSRRAPARLRLAGKELIVVEANRSELPAQPGVVVADRSGLVLGFSDGAVLARVVRPQGRPDTDAAAFARGARIDSQTRWERIT